MVQEILKGKLYISDLATLKTRPSVEISSVLSLVAESVTSVATIIVKLRYMSLFISCLDVCVFILDWLHDLQSTVKHKLIETYTTDQFYPNNHE